MKRILLTASLFGTIIFQSFAQVHKGTHNGQEWVDLGLSVKWATCNVGADNPGDYGKLIYWHDEVDYDEWSPEWRLPSKHHFNELIDKCTWVWKVVDGNPGYYITGPNGASIFFRHLVILMGTIHFRKGLWASTGDGMIHPARHIHAY